jgi:N-acyl-D-aspartate/D-glutamate deacylase
MVRSKAGPGHILGKEPANTANSGAIPLMELRSSLCRSRIGTIYFLMSEDNVKKKLTKPWISFCSDEASQAPEGVFLKSNPHPRAYGNFARVLGKYCRDEKVISMPEAIRRLSALPATNLGLDRRGMLKEGMFADVVVFDPEAIADRATYENPPPKFPLKFQRQRSKFWCAKHHCAYN